ncbi:MAG: HNH endonuclease signature motif containing protein, partial [Microthrixaceae bacterium]
RATLRALALTEICRRATAKPVGSTTPGRPEVSLSVGPDNFGHGVTRWGDTVTISDSVLFCVADLVTILTDTHGNPKRMGPGFPFPTPPQPTGGFGVSGDQYARLLEEFEAALPASWEHTKWQLERGRQIRYATPEQRRALASRDGGCVFPGCDMPHAWTDAHHVTWWRNGGTTDIDQLISLCRRHHGVAHTTGWNVTLDKHGWTHWSTPNGRHLHGQRHHSRPNTTSDTPGRPPQDKRPPVEPPCDKRPPGEPPSAKPGDHLPPGQPPGQPPGSPPDEHPPRSMPEQIDPPRTGPPGTDPPCCGHD